MGCSRTSSARLGQCFALVAVHKPTAKSRVALPTARTRALRAPASEDRDLVADESILIAPTWRVPESHEKGWYSQPLRAARFGVAISLIIGLAALLWLTGFF